MSTRMISRAPRITAPLAPQDDIHVDAPPALIRPLPVNILATAMPVVMVAGMIGFVVITGAGMTSLLMGGMMAISMVGMLVSGGRSQGSSPAVLDEERADYLRHLAQVRSTVRATAVAQRVAQAWVHPVPDALVCLVRGGRLWERRRVDSDALRVRIGRGPQQLATRLVPSPVGSPDEPEPLSASALHRLIRAHSTIAELPLTLDLRALPMIAVSGPQARSVARAIVVQACAHHAPDDLLLAIVTAGEARAQWEWTKWLPHLEHPTEIDALGGARMLASSLAEVEAWLKPYLADRPQFITTEARTTDGPHVLVVIDGGSCTGEERSIADDGLAGVTVLDLSLVTVSEGRRGLRLECADGRIGEWSGSGIQWWGVPDRVALPLAEAIARGIAPWRVDATSTAAQPSPAGARGLSGLLGLDDPGSFDVTAAWRVRSAEARLRIPIGIDVYGNPVQLDLKEAAQGGMGPHGLIIGATGSGKSEVLRTLVMGLAATHSSAALNVVLIDFKGGATFLGLRQLPHVAAVITNLSDDLTMVDRMRDALAGEMNRRQKLLRDAGNFASATDYERARESGIPLHPLPALLIVCDEFTELLTQKPDLAELFVAIGRLGRSLSMHLLLASQRLDEGRMRGLDAHLSYRIGLKTFSAAESRAVLTVPDAYELPPVPGSGFLRFDNTLVRFKAAFVSGPHVRTAVAGPRLVDRSTRLFTCDYVPIPGASSSRRGTAAAASERAVVAGVAPSELEVMVGRLAGNGPAAHEVWLPPLLEPPTLDRLLPVIGVSDRGLGPVNWTGNGQLRVPIALVDRPFQQRRDPLWADFAGASGHALVVGGPHSGKSNLLRAIVCALALTHTPVEVQCYVIDLGGGALTALAALPHVGDVASRADRNVVRRMVAEMVTILADREARFRQLGLESMVTYRAMRIAGQLPQDNFGDAFLVIDGWAAFRAEFEDLEPQVLRLTQQGLSFGVHVIIAAGRWAEVRPAMKDMMSSRFELRLGDPAESEIDRRVASGVPAGVPGRGLSPEKLHFLTTLPRMDGVASTADLADSVAAMVAAHRDAWRGPRAPRVRLLPALLSYDALPTASDGRTHIPVGISEATMEPVYLDVRAEPHLLVLGDSECGKTSFLRTFGQQIMERRTPQQARFLVVDYRRTLLQAFPDEYLAGYAATATAASSFVADVVDLMRSRLPGPDVTAEHLRARSWWTGAELYVLVDDYDLVQAPSGNPLLPLVEFLAQAPDLGLHLVLCRRAGGAARSMYEPVMQRIRDLGSAGILMSGPPDEGVLLGTLRPRRLPPGRGYLVSRRAGQHLVQLAHRG